MRRVLYIIMTLVCLLPLVAQADTNANVQTQIVVQSKDGTRAIALQIGLDNFLRLVNPYLTPGSGYPYGTPGPYSYGGYAPAGVYPLPGINDPRAWSGPGVSFQYADRWTVPVQNILGVPIRVVNKSDNNPLTNERIIAPGGIAYFSLSPGHYTFGWGVPKDRGGWDMYSGGDPGFWIGASGGNPGLAGNYPPVTPPIPNGVPLFGRYNQ